VAAGGVALGRRLDRPTQPGAARRLAAEGASLHPTRPRGSGNAWVNRALETSRDRRAARGRGQVLRAATHQDAAEELGLLVALGIILDRTARADPISRWGHRPTRACFPGSPSTVPRPAGNRSSGRRPPGPGRSVSSDGLTRTTFPDRSFAAIACLSVVEHGVDIQVPARGGPAPAAGRAPRDVHRLLGASRSRRPI